ILGRAGASAAALIVKVKGNRRIVVSSRGIMELSSRFLRLAGRSAFAGKPPVELAQDLRPLALPLEQGDGKQPYPRPLHHEMTLEAHRGGVGSGETDQVDGEN